MQPRLFVQKDLGIVSRFHMPCEKIDQRVFCCCKSKIADEEARAFRVFLDGQNFLRHFRKPGQGCFEHLWGCLTFCTWPTSEITPYWLGSMEDIRCKRVYLPSLIRSFLPSRCCSDLAIAAVCSASVRKSTYAKLPKQYREGIALGHLF